MDVGVADDERGRTLLVKLNDAYALGCYRLPRTKYVHMVEARWE